MNSSRAKFSASSPGRAEGASPVIPIPGHGLTLLSEMAGTRPAMTFQFLARAWLPIPTARCTGRSRGCWRSPTCISKKAQALRRAACCCRLTTPPRRWRGSRGLSRTMLRVTSSPSATVSTMAAARRVSPMMTARPCASCSAAANGSGSPAITILSRPPASAGHLSNSLTLDALTFRHLPSGTAGEICGHLHPVARISHRAAR